METLILDRSTIKCLKGPQQPWLFDKLTNPHWQMTEPAFTSDCKSPAANFPQLHCPRLKSFQSKYVRLVTAEPNNQQILSQKHQQLIWSPFRKKPLCQVAVTGISSALPASLAVVWQLLSAGEEERTRCVQHGDNHDTSQAKDKQRGWGQLG